jgi:putrescine aminotransferase
MPTTTTSYLQDLDRKHHLHPFTNHAEMHATGTHVITSAKGVWIIDAERRRLLDGLAGLWCVNVGYGCTEIIDAVKAQMEELAFYPSFFNSTTEPTIKLAERLSQIAPPTVGHTFFCSSGSESIETALKFIRAYHYLKGKPEKQKIVSRKFAYHGVTLGAASVTGLVPLHTQFALPLPGFVHAPAPYHYGADTDLSPDQYGQWCLQETAKLIESEGPDTVAAIFAEPLQGAGGVVTAPPGYLDGLRSLADEYDLLFVADEVITGFGRLGDWFASSMWNLRPDIVTMAKGLTSGYIPMGATMVSKEIADTVINGGNFAHGYTYSGHPVAAAAALATLDYMEKENVIPTVRDDVGPYFQKKLHALSNHRAVGEVRGCQLIGAIEVVPRGGKAKLVPNGYLGLKAAALCREEGVVVRGIRDMIAMSPPLIISHEEIDILFAAIEKALDRLWD